MKKLKKIQLVQRYIIVDDELIYTTRDDDQNDQIVSNYLQLDLETWSDFLYIIDREHILVRLNTGLGMILNYYSGRYKYLNNFKSNNVSGSRIVFSRGGTFDQSFGVFNLSQNIEYFSTKELIGNTIFEDKIYSDFKNIISCRQVETGKLDWEFPLSVYGTYFQNGEDHPMKLRGFGGVYEGVLYLWAGVGLLLGIDVASGKEVFKFKLDEDAVGYIRFDVEQGSFLSLNSNCYAEVDVSTKRYQKFDIKSDIEKNKVNVSMLGSCEGGLISFYEGVDCNRFAVFSREEKKIVWTGEIEEVKDMFPAIIGMKHSGNKLYVHDIMKTLHIFELE